jgi:ubiquinone biosynthesis protein COQ9
MSREDLELRDLILLATLPHVVFEGWTDAAVASGIDDLADVPEIGSKSVSQVFPGGMGDLAAHFSDWTDRRMVAEMAKQDVESMKVRARIALGVRSRLEVLTPHREAVRCCLAYLALPTNAGLSLKCGYKTVSEIWYATGDESADFSFYTKRAMLAPVLAATTLYWLADEGDGDGDFPETWDFLDRRIADVLNIMQARIRMTKRLEKMPSPFSICKRFAAAQAQR